MAGQIPNGNGPNGLDVDMLKAENAVEVGALNVERTDSVDEKCQAPMNTVPAMQQNQTPVPQMYQPSPQPILPAPTQGALAAASARPTSMPPQPSARPEKPVAHGGPTRQYLNQAVTPHLLEGMKYLAVYEPEKPLQWLADFLRDRSKEVEG